MDGVKLKIRVQPALCVGWRAKDPGDWVFTLCRRGIEELLGRRLKLNSTLTVTMYVEEEPNGYIPGCIPGSISEQDPQSD